MEEIIKKLILNNKTISTMESCTGGGVANSITNIEGASEVFSFAAVTYSNEYKIKMGVNSQTIDKYSVYSMEVAKEMSRAISNYTNSCYGVGITGKLNRIDKYNLYGEDNTVYISVYDKYFDKYYTNSIKVDKNTRRDNKELVINEVKKILMNVLVVKE